jgi:glycerol-3-phosphate dehydrogenase
MNLEADAPLKSLPEYTRREIMFLVQHEKVMRLDDLLLRRTMLAMLGHLTREIVQELADILGDCMGWGVDQKNAEAAYALHLLSDRHGVRL